MLTLSSLRPVTLKNVKIIGSKNRLLYNIIPNSFPASRYYVHRAPDDEAITEYIQVLSSCPLGTFAL